MVSAYIQGIQAYNNAKTMLRGVQPTPGETLGVNSSSQVSGAQSGFLDIFKSMWSQNVASLRRSEQVGVQSVTSSVPLSEVVTSVAEAETSLRLMVAVRNKVVSAYNEIMKMPI